MASTSDQDINDRGLNAAEMIRAGASRQALSRAACLDLLAPGGRGRVAATMRAIPVVIPVTFSLLGGDVVFVPGIGEGRSKAVQNSVVAFETDQVEIDGNAMWDIHVTGVARMIPGDTSGPRFLLSSDIMADWKSDVPRPSVPDHPGTRLSNLDYAPISEMLGRVGFASEVLNCAAPDTGNMEILNRYGSPAVREHWLGHFSQERSGARSR
ncbi:MAG: hypothetical protein NVS3B21_34090 [Acidimicrobiales bacterium]